jgi:Family of unknown function (DUF6949)
MHYVWVASFAIATGFTASGIAANLYRLLLPNRDGGLAKVLYAPVMIVAGPNVVLGNAASAFRKKGCSRGAFWMAALVCGYWSFAIGLLVLDISLAL